MDSADGMRGARRRVTEPVDGLAQAVTEHVLGRVTGALDVNALLDRVDLNALLDRVDLNRLLARVDLNTVLDRIDIDALVEETDIGAVLSRSSAGAASRVLDVVRGQAVRLDELAARGVARLLRRRYPGAPGGPGLPPAGTQ